MQGMPDFGSAAFIADPWPTYRAALDVGGLTHDESGTVFTVYRPDLVEQVLHDPGFTAAHPLRRTRQLLGPNVLDTDGAQHKRLRAGVGDLLARQVRARLSGDRLDELTAGLLHAVDPQCNENWVTEFSVRLPYLVLAEVLRWPLLAEPEVPGRLRPAIAYIDMAALAPSKAHEAIRELAGQAVGGTTSCGVLEEPTGSALFDAMAEAERLANVLLLVLAGTETLSAAITNLLADLAAAPGRHQPAVQRDGVLAGLVAVPPVHFTTRFAREPLHLDRVQIPGGATVLVCLPTAVQRPDGPSARPGPTGRLVFGAGRHRCLGASLAVAELRAVASVIIEAFGRLVPVVTPPPPTGRTIRARRGLRLGPE